MEQLFLQNWTSPESKNEATAIAELRNEVKRIFSPEDAKASIYYQEVLVSDVAAMRFLIARKFDTAKAAALIAESSAMRAKMGLDRLLEAPVSATLKKIWSMYPCCWQGFDKRGYPIYIEFMGQLDVTAIVEQSSMEELLYFHSVCQEFTRRKACAEATKRAGRRIDGSVAIIDLGGLGRKHCRKLAYHFLSSIAKSDSLLYPESLVETWIINAGLLFAAAYAIVRPFIDERTTSKFKIYRSDGRADMCAQLGVENLPAYFGGTAAGNATDRAGVLANAPLSPSMLYLMENGNTKHAAKFGSAWGEAPPEADKKDQTGAASPSSGSEKESKAVSPDAVVVAVAMAVTIEADIEVCAFEDMGSEVSVNSAADSSQPPGGVVAPSSNSSALSSLADSRTDSPSRVNNSQ